MDKEHFQTMLNLGFSNGETKVYLSLLELKKSSVGNIVKKSMVSSSKVYEILEKLIEKGVVASNKEGNVKYFYATGMKSLQDILGSKKDSFVQLEADFQKLIPKLKSIEKSHEDESYIYKGTKGIKSGFFEALKHPSTKEYLFFATGYAKDESFDNFIKQITDNVNELKIPIRGFLHESERGLFEKRYKKRKYQVKFMKRFWPADISIIGDFVFTLLWKKDDPILYAIKSKAISKSYREFFNKQWAEGD